MTLALSPCSVTSPVSLLPCTSQFPLWKFHPSKERGKQTPQKCKNPQAQPGLFCPQGAGLGRRRRRRAECTGPHLNLMRVAVGRHPQGARPDPLITNPQADGTEALLRHTSAPARKQVSFIRVFLQYRARVRMCVVSLPKSNAFYLGHDHNSLQSGLKILGER